jgi:hypothetical protein
VEWQKRTSFVTRTKIGGFHGSFNARHENDFKNFLKPSSF